MCVCVCVCIYIYIYIYIYIEGKRENRKDNKLISILNKGVDVG